MLIAPIRIQRLRKPGWRMPEGAICVSRPTKWGNPVKLKDGKIYIDASWRLGAANKWRWLLDGEIGQVISIYEMLLKGEYVGNDPDLLHWNKLANLPLEELRKYNAMACFCPIEQPCHVDVLIKALEDYFHPGDKIIWDSGFGFEIGEFVSKKGVVFNSVLVKLATGIVPNKVCSLPPREIYHYTKELEEKLKNRYKAVS